MERQNITADTRESTPDTKNSSMNADKQFLMEDIGEGRQGVAKAGQKSRDKRAATIGIATQAVLDSTKRVKSLDVDDSTSRKKRANSARVNKEECETENLKEIKEILNPTLIKSEEELRKHSSEVRAIWEQGNNERWWIDSEEFKISKKEFASGACGKVYSAKWRSMYVAIKTIKVRNKKAIHALQKEVLIWSSIRHPNCVSFLGASLNKTHGIMIAMEYMKGGDLQNLLDAQGKLGYARAYRIAMDMARGLCFLHMCKPLILHRDLKPPNVLFDENGVAKIADFGLSKTMHPDLRTYRMTSKTGTVRYMAPEVLLGKKYTCSVDVYSFGMIMSYMFSGQKPFYGYTVKSRTMEAKEGKEEVLPYNLAPLEKDMITKCVQHDPEKRIKIDELFKLLKANRMTR